MVLEISALRTHLNLSTEIAETQWHVIRNPKTSSLD